MREEKQNLFLSLLLKTASKIQLVHEQVLRMENKIYMSGRFLSFGGCFLFVNPVDRLSLLT